MSKTGDMLSKLLTESRLRTLAGGRAFGRGADYFESGAVTDLIDGGDTIKARVEGTYEYEVSLRPERKTLGYDCTCPVGEAGDFCKHAVAVGLAWPGWRSTQVTETRPRLIPAATRSRPCAVTCKGKTKRCW